MHVDTASTPITVSEPGPTTPAPVVASHPEAEAEFVSTETAQAEPTMQDAVDISEDPYASSPIKPASEDETHPAVADVSASTASVEKEEDEEEDSSSINTAALVGAAGAVGAGIASLAAVAVNQSEKAVESIAAVAREQMVENQEQVEQQQSQPKEEAFQPRSVSDLLSHKPSNNAEVRFFFSSIKTIIMVVSRWEVSFLDVKTLPFRVTCTDVLRWNVLFFLLDLILTLDWLQPRRAPFDACRRAHQRLPYASRHLPYGRKDRGRRVTAGGGRGGLCEGRRPQGNVGQRGRRSIIRRR